MLKRILVIDDETSIRKAFSLALEDSGYQIDTAESGEKGLEFVMQHPYDLIFLDLKMPGYNGVETLERIREHNREVPVYIITAFHGEFFADLKRAQQEGYDFQVLRKPISADEIRLLARAVLEGAVAY